MIHPRVRRTPWLGLLALCGVGCGYAGVDRYVPLEQSGQAMVVALLSDDEAFAGYGENGPGLVHLRLSDGRIIFDYGKLDGPVVAISVDRGRVFVVTPHSLVEVDTQKRTATVRCTYAETLNGVIAHGGNLFVSHATAVLSISRDTWGGTPVLSFTPPEEPIFGLIPSMDNRIIVVLRGTPNAMILEPGSGRSPTPVRADLYERGIWIHPEAVSLKNGKVIFAGGPAHDIRLVDLAAGVTERRWEVGPFPRGLAVSSDEKKVYTLTTRGIAVVPLTP